MYRTLCVAYLTPQRKQLRKSVIIFLHINTSAIRRVYGGKVILIVRSVTICVLVMVMLVMSIAKFHI